MPSYPNEGAWRGQGFRGASTTIVSTSAVSPSVESEPTVATVPMLRQPLIRRLLLLTLLAEIGYAVLNISTMPVYLKFDRHYGTTVIGFVLVAFLLSEAVFKSPMGSLADRIGRKRLIVIGPAMTFGTALLTLATRYFGAGEIPALIALRILDGLGAAMLWPAIFALVGDLVGDSERQKAMSLLNTCYLVGIALALPIGGLVNDLFGTYFADSSGSRSPSLYLAAALFITVALIAFRSLPSDKEARRHLQHHEHHEPGLAEFMLSVKRIPKYLLLAVVTFAGIGFPMAIIKVFAEQQFGMKEAAFGALVFPAAILMAVLSVPMARYGEKIGRARAVHYGMGLCTGGLFAIASGAFVPWLRTPLLIALGGAAVGFGFLLCLPAWLASVSDIDPKRRGAFLGAVMTAQGLGAIIGAPIGAAMYDGLQPVGVNIGLGEAFGRYSPFFGCAVCVMAGWLLSLRLLHEPKEGIEPTVP
jgi:DHA1 family multidrug resistance protein-like MFS transporter